jgi:hypothetical protein
MIHRRHRDAAVKQGGFVLKKEKVVHNGMNTMQGGTAKGPGTQYFQYRPRQGLFPYRASCAVMNHENSWKLRWKSLAYDSSF